MRTDTPIQRRLREALRACVLPDEGTSGWFLDAQRVTFADPKLVTHAVLETLNDTRLERLDAVGGPALGAVPIAVAVAAHSALRSFAVTKDCVVAGDLREGDRVLIVEDVVETARSLTRAVSVALDEGAVVVAVLALVNRGAPADVVALPTVIGDKTLEPRSVPFIALFTADDLLT